VEDVEAAFVDDGGTVALGRGERPRKQVRAGHVLLQQRRRRPHVLQQHRHLTLQERDLMNGAMNSVTRVLPLICVEMNSVAKFDKTTNGAFSELNWAGWVWGLFFFLISCYLSFFLI